jgi:hypothetical protein
MRKNRDNPLICILERLRNCSEQYIIFSGNVGVVRVIQAVQNADAVGSVLRKMLTTQNLLFWDPVEQVILLE